MKKFISQIIILSLAIFATAQNQSFYSSNDGLSNSLINYTLQDHKGYIWIATENGLNKYDGYRFTKYFHNETDSCSILNNYVYTLFEDHDQRLWIGTNNGLQTYNRTKDHFEIIPVRNIDRSVHITNIAQRKSGDILIATQGQGLLVAKIKDQKIICERNDSINQILKSLYLNKIIEDAYRNVWIGDNSGNIYKLVAGSNSIVTYNLKKGNTTPIISDIFEDADGTIYVATLNEGIYKLDKYENRFYVLENKSKDAKIIAKQLFLSNNQLIIATDGTGCKEISKKDNSIQESSFLSTKTPFDLSNKKIHHIFRDKDNNIWLSMYQKGVLMVSESTFGFEYWGANSSRNNIIGSNCIMSVTKDSQDRYWVGTDNDGVYQVNKTGKSSIHFKANSSAGYFPNTVMSLFEDSNKDLWVGSFYEGLYKLDHRTGKSVEFDITPESKSTKYDKTISSIKEDSSKVLWIGTSFMGVRRIDLRTGKIITNKIHGALSNEWINTLLVAKNQDVWIGSSWGLNVYNRKSNEYIRFDESELKNKSILALEEGVQGEIWIGTDKGLYLYKDETFKRFSQKDGLASDMISAIVKDKTGNIWITTRSGLSKFDNATHEFINFYSENGIQNNEFSRGAIYYDNSNDFIITGGIEGITLFNPYLLNYKVADITKDKVWITDFYISNNKISQETKSGGKAITDRPVIDTEAFELNHRDNSFSVELSIFKYSYNKDTKYYYKLDNYDGEWKYINPGDNPRINYSNLNPGSYKLKIKATNKYSTSEEKTITIVVTPPWYLSWWAILLWIGAAISGIWLIARYYINKRKQENIINQLIREEELSEAKLQYFTNVSHEIRTPISLIISPLEEMIKKSNDNQQYLQTMWRCSQRILSLVNQMLDLRKIEKNQFSLSRSIVNINTFMEDILNSFSFESQVKNIQLSLSSETKDDIEALIDPFNFDKVIYNILSNAFKFTEQGGEIRVHLKSDDENFYISFSDSGCGISSEDIDSIFNRFYQSDKASHKNSGSGLGLYLSKELVELHGGNISVSNRQDQNGCIFEIRVPLGIKPGEKKTGNKEIYSGTEIYHKVISKSEPKEIQLCDHQEEESKAKKKKQTVLIIDDQMEMRQYLKEILSAQYYVVESSNGKDGFDVALKIHPDLIISDVMMPHTDGVTLCKMIKENNVINDIPVILLSACNTKDYELNGYHFGADAYLSKPFNIDILQSRVRNLIEAKEKYKLKITSESLIKERISKPFLSNNDELLLDKIVKSINQNISNPDYNIDLLCSDVGISRVHIYRKLKELTNQAPADFIKSTRLKMALELVHENKHNISDIAYAVGFSSVAHFSRSFKSYYGYSPKHYIEQHLKKNA
ncbi:MAG: two-component regulator propeller domain-containing protein [Bacteroidales bacterium]